MASARQGGRPLVLSPGELLAQQVKCALLSEGLCPKCRALLVVPLVNGRPWGWAACELCRVEYRTSGRGDVSFTWEVRMTEHRSLDPLDGAESTL